MSILTDVEPDRRAVEAFQARLLEVANHGALALAISVGHRTGLLDALGELPEGTSHEIAGRAGLDERYVREWLGAMTAGRMVVFDPATDRYHLPAAHAALLTRRADPHNLAVVMQWIPVLARVEDRLVESFRQGGGVHYHEYPRFHDVMAEMSGETVVAALFDGILPLAPGLTERLREGIDVLDAGCGQGRALMAMASEFPNSRFRGYDLSAHAIAAARAAAREMGLRNVTFLAADLSLVQEEEAYDLVTAFDSIHDQARPDTVLSNLHRALRPGGLFLMQDIATHSALDENLGHPLGPLLYTLSFGHCMSVSLAQGGAGLGTCWGRELAEEMLARAGFQGIRVHRLPHDILNFFYVMER